MRSIKLILAGVLLFGPLAACSGADDGNVVVASEQMISITTTRLGDPTEQAQAHCAKYGKQAVSRGGVPMGDPAYKIMWGFDCVAPGTK